MTEQPSTSAPAVRLIFEYEGDTVRLVSQDPVDVDIPRFDAPTEHLADHFVETRDAEGALLARVPVRGGFVQSTEVFPEDHASRSPASKRKRAVRSPWWFPTRTTRCEVAVMRAGRAHGRGGHEPAPASSPARRRGGGP